MAVASSFELAGADCLRSWNAWHWIAHYHTLSEVVLVCEEWIYPPLGLQVRIIILTTWHLKFLGLTTSPFAGPTSNCQVIITTPACHAMPLAIGGTFCFGGITSEEKKHWARGPVGLHILHQLWPSHTQSFAALENMVLRRGAYKKEARPFAKSLHPWPFGSLEPASIQWLDVIGYDIMNHHKQMSLDSEVKRVSLFLFQVIHPHLTSTLELMVGTVTHVKRGPSGEEVRRAA